MHLLKKVEIETGCIVPDGSENFHISLGAGMNCFRVPSRGLCKGARHAVPLVTEYLQNSGHIKRYVCVRIDRFVDTERCF